MPVVTDRPYNAGDEAALVDSARNGDADAFGVLVARYMPRALAFARQMTGSVQDAEDIVQDSFVKAYRSIGSFRGESGFYTWFYRLLANACMDHLRRGSIARKLFFWKREDDGDDRPGPLETAPDTHPGSSPYRGLEQKQMRAAINGALGRLPERQRAVFLLRHNEGMSTADVAAVLGISEGAVKSHLSRAITALRSGLREYGGT